MEKLLKKLSVLYDSVQMLFFMEKALVSVEVL